MSERERIIAINRAKEALSKAMFALHGVKEYSTSSGKRQLAEAIVRIGDIRESLKAIEP